MRFELLERLIKMVLVDRKKFFETLDILEDYDEDHPIWFIFMRDWLMNAQYFSGVLSRKVNVLAMCKLLDLCLMGSIRDAIPGLYVPNLVPACLSWLNGIASAELDCKLFAESVDVAEDSDEMVGFFQVNDLKYVDVFYEFDSRMQVMQEFAPDFYAEMVNQNDQKLQQRLLLLHAMVEQSRSWLMMRQTLELRINELEANVRRKVLLLHDVTERDGEDPAALVTILRRQAGS